MRASEHPPPDIQPRFNERGAAAHPPPKGGGVSTTRPSCLTARPRAPPSLRRSAPRASRCTRTCRSSIRLTHTQYQDLPAGGGPPRRPVRCCRHSLPATVSRSSPSTAATTRFPAPASSPTSHRAREADLRALPARSPCPTPCVRNRFAPYLAWPSTRGTRSRPRNDGSDPVVVEGEGAENEQGEDNLSCVPCARWTVGALRWVCMHYEPNPSFRGLSLSDRRRRTLARALIGDADVPAAREILGDRLAHGGAS